MSVVSGLAYLFENGVRTSGLLEFEFVMKYFILLLKNMMEKKGQGQTARNLDQFHSPPLWGKLRKFVHKKCEHSK